MPIDRGVIDQQLQALGESASWWNHRELRDLPAVLDADERILAIGRGKIARLRWLRRSWLIIVSDRRLLCMRSGSRTGWRQLEVSADQITRVSLRVGIFRGRVLIAAGGHTYRLLVPRAVAYRLSTALTGLARAGQERLPGFGPTRMVRRVIDHVLALPAAAFDPTTPAPATAPVVRIDTSQLDRRFELLEDQVQELQKQVEFLEQLLRDRRIAQVASQEYP